MTTYVNITNSQFLSPTFVGDTSVTYLVVDLFNKPTYTWVSQGVWNLVAWTTNTNQNVTAPSNSSTGLTDAELRATPVEVSVTSGGGATGGATEVTLANIDADLGAKGDAAASADTGSFSVIAFIKRGLTNWTTLLGRLPGSLGTKTAAASLPVVLASDQTLPLPSGSATSALQTTGNTSLGTIVTNTGNINTKLPTQVGGRVPVDGSGVTQPVSAVVRACTGRQSLVLTAATVTSLTVPGGSVACSIQADGNTVRVTQDASAPSATAGVRVDDGVVYYIDTDLANVRVFAPIACSVQVTYFDKA